LVAEEMGCNPEDSRLIARAAALHDIGKASIDSAVLNKPDPLDAHEAELMRLHPLVGSIRLRSLPQTAQLALAADIALEHHEWWNGKGYPSGKSGSEISLAARITSICDVYAALREKRSYKHGLGHGSAMRKIMAGSGSQFDPDVVRAFVRCELQIEKALDARLARDLRR
jgi:putative two-component system response regulator